MTRREYRERQDGSGLKKGDFVTVERIVEKGECPSDCRTSWVDDSRAYLGKSGKIIGMGGCEGCGIDVWFQEAGWTISLPFFALKKARSAHGFMKPFDRVLVRQNDGEDWSCAFYETRTDGGYRVMGGKIWKQCVPYEKNEYLIPEFR